MPGPPFPDSLPQRCIKKVEKTSQNVMGVESKANPGLITGTNQQYIPGSVRFFSIFFTLSGKPEDSISGVAKGLQ